MTFHIQAKLDKSIDWFTAHETEVEQQVLWTDKQWKFAKIAEIKKSITEKSKKGNDFMTVLKAIENAE